jgi:hypothetical protein
MPTPNAGLAGSSGKSPYRFLPCRCSFECVFGCRELGFNFLQLLITLSQCCARTRSELLQLLIPFSQCFARACGLTFDRRQCSAGFTRFIVELLVTSYRANQYSNEQHTDILQHQLT